MAFSVRFVTCLIGCALLAGPGGLAQPVPPPEVDVVFTVVAAERRAWLYYQTKPEGPWAAVEAFTQARSAPCAYRGPARLALYDRLPTAGDLPAPAPVVTVLVPVGMARPLLVWMAGERGVEVAVVDDSPAALPDGCMAMVNTTPVTYAVQVGGRRLLAGAGVSEALPVSGRVHLKLAGWDKGRWFRAAAHDFTMPEGGRAYVVLLPPASPTGLSPRLRVLQEAARTDTGAAREDAP